MPRGRKKKFKLNFNINPSAVRSIIALVLVLFAILSLISFFAPSYAVNSHIQKLIRGLFGYPSIILPFLLGMGGILFIDKVDMKFKEFRVLFGLGLFLISASGFFHVFVNSEKAHEVALNGGGGGLIGYKMVQILSNSLSIYGAAVVLVIAIVISVVLTFNVSFEGVSEFFKQLFSLDKLANIFKFSLPKKNGEKSLGDDVEVSQSPLLGHNEQPKIPEPLVKVPTFEILPTASEPHVYSAENAASSASSTPSATLSSLAKLPTDRIWQLPSLDLLIDPPSEIKDTSDVDMRKRKIKEKLKQFDIDVDIVDTNIGSAVTQYMLQTKSVTKISKISSLQEDLALAMASSTGSVRVEAPIPGTSYIGIEVPNTNRSLVYFKSLVTSDAMKGLKSRLSITLGRDVAGKTYAYDIGKMPHLLIAGTTGSGKSIFIHNILFSILFRATPNEVKFILVDPKRVELNHYQDIPHLLTPVVTDMDKAPSVFRWAVDEMDRRYKLFEQAKVRNIEGYNEKSGIQVMPYIVIVVDELAEIMVRDPAGVEKSIIRLAQLARATGIHLVLAVQRPSTNIITGLIKANISCRVAFKVPSQIDSRVIIDQPGAEKLLGKGDMLFMPPDAAKSIRLQGSYISDAEIINLVSFLKNQGVAPDYKDEVLEMPSDTASVKGGSGGKSMWGDGLDDLFDEAVDIVLTSGKASASLLQRKLSIGYARAARIIDDMEAKSIIGPSVGGSKARDILIDGMPDIKAPEDDYGRNSGYDTDHDLKSPSVDSLQDF